MKTLAPYGLIAATVLGVGQMSPAGAIEYGREVEVLPYGFALVPGMNWETSFWGVEQSRRYIRYVVSKEVDAWPGDKGDRTKYRARAEYRTFEATHTEYLGSTYGVEGIELELGYAYVCIRPTPFPYTPSAVDYVSLTLQDPARFVPILATWADDVDDLPAKVELAALWFLANPWVLDVLAVRAGERDDPDAGLRPDDVRRVVNLWRDRPRPAGPALNRATCETDPAELTVLVSQLIMEAIAVPHIQDVYAYFNFPFILTRRIPGGAAGTEVVAYAGPDPDPEPSKHGQEVVYYFYVASDGTHPVKLFGYWRDQGGNVFTTQESIDKCEYARVPVTLIDVAPPNAPDSQFEWFVTDPGAVSTGPIESLADEVKDLIRAAHMDACIADVLPSAVNCGAFDQACP